MMLNQSMERGQGFDDFRNIYCAKDFEGVKLISFSVSFKIASKARSSRKELFMQQRYYVIRFYTKLALLQTPCLNYCVEIG